MSDRQLRHFCRNKNCRTKLAVPADNHHKAFCSSSCHEQFYRWRCNVCEKEIPRDKHSKPRNCCRSKECQKDFRLYRDAYVMPRKASAVQVGENCKSDSKSAHFTGAKSALADSLAGYRVIAGPSLSPPERVSEAEWRERDAADARYVAEDEKRLRNSTSV